MMVLVESHELILVFFGVCIVDLLMGACRVRQHEDTAHARTGEKGLLRLALS